MLLPLPGLIDEKELESIDRILADAPFVEGAVTAGPAAASVKNNLQLDRKQTRDIAKLDAIIMDALSNNATFRAGAIPRRILPPYFSKYSEGMSYGSHVDNPIISDGTTTVRTDLSITVFLSDPDSYDGGELMIKTETGDTRVKLPRGDAIIYPTGAYHAVNTVTRGVRLAAVTWIESMIADPYQRRMIYELDIVNQSIRQKLPDSEEARVLHKIFGNLFRLWGSV